MKNKLTLALLSLGWILLLVFLASSVFVSKYYNGTQNQLASAISWDHQVSVFEGAIACTLGSEALEERKAALRKEIFSKVKKKTELNNGYIYYFDDEQGLTENIMEFIRKEKECCPFFKFDLSILPFGNGLAVQISGTKEVKAFLLAFEEES